MIKYDIANIEAERRNGYAWYGGWGSDVASQYSRWKEQWDPKLHPGFVKHAQQAVRPPGIHLMPFRSLAAVRWRANLEAFRRCRIGSRLWPVPNPVDGLRRCLENVAFSP